MGLLQRITRYVLVSAAALSLASCAPRLHDGTVLEGAQVPLELRVRQMPGNEDIEGGLVEYWCWTAERDERVVATEIDFQDGSYEARNVGGGVHRYGEDGWQTIVCRAYGDGVFGIRSVQFRID